MFRSRLKYKSISVGTDKGELGRIYSFRRKAGEPIKLIIIFCWKLSTLVKVDSLQWSVDPIFWRQVNAGTVWVGAHQAAPKTWLRFVFQPLPALKFWHRKPGCTGCSTRRTNNAAAKQLGASSRISEIFSVDFSRKYFPFFHFSSIFEQFCN